MKKPTSDNTLNLLLIIIIVAGIFFIFYKFSPDFNQVKPNECNLDSDDRFYSMVFIEGRKVSKEYLTDFNRFCFEDYPVKIFPENSSRNDKERITDIIYGLENGTEYVVPEGEFWNIQYIGKSNDTSNVSEISNTLDTSNTFTPTTLQPSLYSEGKIKIYNNPSMVTIYASQEDSFALTRVISSKSMKPLIPDNATVIYRLNFTEEDLRIGEVVGIARNIEEYGTDLDLVHRIINIEENNGEECYITKGDNNKKSDPYCWNFSEIVGIVVGVINIQF